MTPALEVLKPESFGTENLIVNGGFERTSRNAARGWEPYGRGYSLAPGEGRDGGTCIHCLSSDTGSTYGAHQTVRLEQKEASPVLVAGWSRARDVAGGKTNDYSIYVDVTYQDGTHLWGQTARFDTGTHAWQRAQVVIMPTRPIKSMAVYALFRRIQGEVWFDGLEARPLAAGGAAVLDGVPVVLRETVPAREPELSETLGLSSGDGLHLDYAPRDGRVVSLRLDGTELAGGSVSGFLVRDVAAESDFYHFEDGLCPALGLKLDVSFDAEPRCIRASGRLTDLRGTDRAVTLAFALPVQARGWHWHDDVRHARRIERGAEYVNVSDVGTGSNGKLSVYPLGCIAGGDGGLALAIDMGMPAQYRIGYSGGTGAFYIAYDFGLAVETDNFPSAAPFSFVIYRTDPRWGFRSALRGLYELFPDYFVCRSKKQGIWMPFTDVSTVHGWQDFGFRYHEGNNNVPFDDSADILSFRYTEPSTFWLAIPPEVPRTPENVMKALNEATRSDNPWRRRYARAAIVSGSYDAAGHIQYLVRNAPWTNGVVFSLNPNPYIPGDSEARMYWNPEIKRQLYGPGARGIQDGEYLDSLEAYVTADENYRREHFHYVTVPLTFSTGSKRPVIHKASSQYEFSRWLAQDVHRMGKLMFANSVPRRFSFLCPWFDVMGTETDWLDAEGRWRPSPDRELNLKRAMCYHKPYLLLMNTSFDRLTPDLVEKYFQRSLFYGMWPSMFSHNASEDPYWKNPNWYNRDRHLFRRYIPLVRLVAEAGWEPITHAASDNPELYLERFGPSQAGELYLTVMNGSAREQKGAITIDAAALRIAPLDSAVDLVCGEALPLEREGSALRLPLTLAPEQVRLVKFKCLRSRQ